MKYTSRLVLGLLTVLMIVSFQNCGQSGMISLESQSGLAKLDGSQPQGDVIIDPDVVPSEEEQTPAQAPVSVVSGDKDQTVSHGSIIHDDRDDDVDVDLSKDDPGYEVDENDGTITKGYQISCAGLNKLVRASSLFVRSSNISSAANSSGALKIVNKDEVSISNHRGLLFLLDIKNILSLKNIRAMILSASADNIGEVENVRALSLMSADNVSKIENFKGLLCLDAVNVLDISNFRGILEVSGNIKKISNFRGILKVKGNIGVLENFRGILKVDGDIGSQSDVKVSLK